MGGREEGEGEGEGKEGMSTSKLLVAFQLLDEFKLMLDPGF